jgi:acyl-CoA thioesterase-1
MPAPLFAFLSYGPFRALRNVTIAFILLLGALLTPATAQTPTIVALGDSLTAGYGLAPEQGFVPQLKAWLAAHGSDVAIANAGVSGDTTAGGVARLDWTLSSGGDALIVNLGGNDLLRGLPPAQAQANLDKILAAAQAKHLPVLLVGLKSSGNYGPDYKAAFDAIYPALAAKYKTLLFPDYFAPLKTTSDDPAALTQFLQGDGIHPNAQGVAAVVAAMGPMVLQLLSEVPK